MSAKRAIVDIGSNTVRLVVYGGPVRAPVVLFNEKVTAKLGRGVGETGLLTEKAMGAALAALARYRILIESAGIRDVTNRVCSRASRRQSPAPTGSWRPFPAPRAWSPILAAAVSN